MMIMAPDQKTPTAERPQEEDIEQPAGDNQEAEEDQLALVDEEQLEREGDQGNQEEGLTYGQQLIGVLRDPSFVAIGLSTVIMAAVSDVYSSNYNAFAATFGFEEVRFFDFFWLEN